MSSVTEEVPTKPAKGRLGNSVHLAIGTFTAAAAQGAIIWGVNRFGGARDLGLYAAAIAILSPLHLAAKLSLTNYVATAGRGVVQWSTAVALTLMASLLATLLSFGAGFVIADSLEVVWLLIPLSLIRWADNVSDTTHGFLVQAESFSLIRRSLQLRSFLSASALVGSMAAGLPLQLSAAVSAGVALSTVTLVDVTRFWPSRAPLDRQRMEALARDTVPLGIGRSLAALMVSVPRIAIERTDGLVALGIFSAVAFVPRAMVPLGQSLVLASAGQIGKLAGEGRLAELSRLAHLQSLRAAGAVVGISFLVAPFARWALDFGMGPAYAEATSVLFIMLLSTAVMMSAMPLQQAAIALRVRSSITSANVLGTMVALILSVLLVPRYGMVGAGWATVASQLARSLLFSWLVRRAPLKAGVSSKD